MKKISIIVLMSILSFNSYSQIKYESGYYIDNAGRKINCLIKNIDWMSNPVEFTFKLTDNSKPKLAKINDVAEFGIDNISKYKRFTVYIDRSSEDISTMSIDKEPEYSKEQLFLKTLVEGKATLYLYANKGLTRYFFSVDSLEADQLICKSYLVSEKKIAQNNAFREQLFTNLKCQSISVLDIQKIRYDIKDLTRIFTSYNHCQNSEVITFEKNKKRDLFNLSVRPGLNSSKLTIDYSGQKIVFNNELNLRLGIEAEFVMPFNKNKWAVIVEPTFQYYKSNIPRTVVISVDYKSIELPIGIRHSFFLNDKSKIFINGSFIYDLPIDSKLIIDYNRVNIKSGINLVFGAGYNYNNKYSMEVRYGTNRDLLTNYLTLKSNYNTFSVIFGYTLF